MVVRCCSTAKSRLQEAKASHWDLAVVFPSLHFVGDSAMPPTDDNPTGSQSQRDDPVGRVAARDHESGYAMRRSKPSCSGDPGANPAAKAHTGEHAIDSARAALRAAAPVQQVARRGEACVVVSVAGANPATRGTALLGRHLYSSTSTRSAAQAESDHAGAPKPGNGHVARSHRSEIASVGGLQLATGDGVLLHLAGAL
jgi:hypothetical protein